MASKLPFKFFKFFPQKFADVMLMSDEEAGARFKALLSRLLMNEAPEGTLEYEMIEETKEVSRMQREKAQKRWTAQRPEPPRTHRSVTEPEFSDVYDYADKEGLTIADAREWYDYQRRVGFNKITTHWKIALKAFCQKKNQ